MEKRDIQFRSCGGNTCDIGRQETGLFLILGIINREAAIYFVSLVYLIGRTGRKLRVLRRGRYI